MSRPLQSLLFGLAAACVAAGAAFGQRMTESLGQPVVVEMVLGASGAIGAE